jgi:chromosome segregation ATPase
MDFLRRTRGENIIRIKQQRKNKDSTPKIKKRLCIGFGDKIKKGHMHHTSKIIKDVNMADKKRPPRSFAAPKEKMIHLHETIDMFLEQLDRQELSKTRLNFEKKQEQDLNSTDNPKINRRQDFVLTKIDEEALQTEFDLRNRLLCDLEHQVIEQQTKCVEKTEMVKQLQEEMDLKDQALRTMQKEFNKNGERSRTLQKEIQIRDRIIQDIKDQLLEKQTWVVENNHFTEQLSRELQQNNRFLRKVEEELQSKNEEFMSSAQKLQQQSMQIDALRTEILSRNKIIDSFQKQIENQQMSLLEEVHAVESLQEHVKSRNEMIAKQSRILQQQQEELKGFQMELSSRNTIIEHLMRELSENQSMFSGTYKVDRTIPPGVSL